MRGNEKDGAWTRPLRIHLGLVFVVLLIGIAGPMLWLSYDRGHDAAYEAIDLEMASISERIVDHYRIAFADKLAMAQLAAALDDMATSPPASLDEKRSFLFKTIELAPELDGIFVGYPDGRFLRLVSLREGSPWRAPLKAPEDAAAALEMIIPDAAGGPTVRWTFLGADGEPTSFIPTKPTDFDPRTRIWYREASQATGPIATEPYFMPFSGAYVKTIALKHKTDPGVVIAADVLMDTVARFLDEERVSPNAQSYIFDPNGKLIVHSNPVLMAELTEIADGQRGDDHVDLAEHDTLLPQIDAALKTLGSGRTHFAHAGKIYEVLLAPIDFVSAFAGYTIAVAAPRSDFTAEVDRGLHQGLAIGAAVLGVGIVITIIISRLISRSLMTLTGQALRLKDFDFSEPPPLRSRISEIVTLNGALASARIAISSFGLYVPKELVRRIVDSGLFDRRAAVRETVTVMFTDIKDFTTISERNAPETVVSMLSDYFELLNGCVEANDGTIVQFLGDSINAMWNAPIASPDHALDACRCALQMKAALADFNAAQRAAGKSELITRIGIHTGPAVVGNVGAEDRLQYTAMGDTVNVASRLEGLNKELGTEILVSKQTRELCPGDIEFTARGEVRVKGRAEPLEVFEPHRIVAPAQSGT